MKTRSAVVPLGGAGTTATGVGWVVDAARFAGADAANLQALAYCGDVGKVKTRTSSAAILGSTGALGTASTPGCPKKTALRGGGFATSTPVGGLAGSALVYESRPNGGSWLSSAVPGGTATSSTLVTNAYCR